VLIVEGLLLQHRPHAAIRVMTELLCCLCVLYVYVCVYLCMPIYVHVCMYVYVYVLIIKGLSLQLRPHAAFHVTTSTTPCGCRRNAQLYLV